MAGACGGCVCAGLCVLLVCARSRASVCKLSLIIPLVENGGRQFFDCGSVGSHIQRTEPQVKRPPREGGHPQCQSLELGHTERLQLHFGDALIFTLGV